mgnify:FL=1
MSNPYDRANPFNTGTRADTFGIRPDLFKELQEVAPKKETIDRLVDSEQELKDTTDRLVAAEQALKDRMDLLDPIMDFGQSYMPTDLRFTGTGRLPFRNQRGPARGVVIENDGLRLLGEGAWQISCTVFASWVLAISGIAVSVEIRCYSPDGTLYSYQRHRTGTDSHHSIDFSADFVVPGPDYFISVHVARAASSREFFGGYALTRLAAKRWSSKFINPPTGGASEGDE